jgi:hypothetical protein
MRLAARACLAFIACFVGVVSYAFAQAPQVLPFKPLAHFSLPVRIYGPPNPKSFTIVDGVNLTVGQKVTLLRYVDADAACRFSGAVTAHGSTGVGVIAVEDAQFTPDKPIPSSLAHCGASLPSKAVTYVPSHSGQDKVYVDMSDGHSTEKVEFDIAVG